MEPADIFGGMFLWVRLVLYTVEELYYDHEVQEVIETLPEGLYPLYCSYLAALPSESTNFSADMRRYSSACVVMVRLQTSV